MSKSGIYTSEFWLSISVVVAATAGLLTGHIDQDTWVTATGVVTAGYGISRGLAK